MTNEIYLISAILALIQAGKAVLDVYNSDFTVEHKDDSSPLTLADKRSHEIIVERLGPFNIPILSEEGKHVPYGERKKWDRVWIVDPLDGTKEFINRNGEFTVNVALISRTRPILGVIYIPVQQVLYFALPNAGAYKLDGGEMIEHLGEKNQTADKQVLLSEVIGVSSILPLSRDPEMPFTIVGSRSHSTSELDNYVEKKREEYGNVKFVSAGSSLKICLVAEETADVYPRMGPTMEWDTAAGQVIAENAGAELICYDTRQPLVYNKEHLLNPWFIVTRIPWNGADEPSVRKDEK